jgi:ethanolamine ammonia-lyase small subunit
VAEIESSDVWLQLRRFTPARIGLGRVGGSVPTRALLDFQLAHARARDAVRAGFDAEAMVCELQGVGFGEAVRVASKARDRMEYLLRPDLGRALDEASRVRLREFLNSPSGEDRARNGAAKISSDVVVVIGDGLSGVAPARHAVPLLGELPQALRDNVTVVVANQARVALGDEIGEILGAQVVLVLIGERPGLSSPDSLGIYLTWGPRVGLTDAERNCISNVRPEGLGYREAARRLEYLLGEARRLKHSGVALKDDSGDAAARAASGFLKA